MIPFSIPNQKQSIAPTNLINQMEKMQSDFNKKQAYRAYFSQNPQPMYFSSQNTSTSGDQMHNGILYFHNF